MLIKFSMRKNLILFKRNNSRSFFFFLSKLQAAFFLLYSKEFIRIECTELKKRKIRKNYALILVKISGNIVLLCVLCNNFGCLIKKNKSEILNKNHSKFKSFSKPSLSLINQIGMIDLAVVNQYINLWGIQIFLELISKSNQKNKIKI